MGNSAWELFCLEHGIALDGSIQPELFDTEMPFFNENKRGQYKPRALHIDLEWSAINEIKIGA
jgi:tubulin alpha